MKADRGYLARSLARYLGVNIEGTGPESLAADFNRFRFLLGATDGEESSPKMSHEPAAGAHHPEPPHARLPASRRSA